MNIIRFTVPGRPVPAARMTRRSQYVNKQAIRYKDYKEVVSWEAKAAGATKIKGDVTANLTFYICQGRRGDIDNLIKSLLDGCNNICYDDDRQVIRIQAEIIKCNKDSQRVEVEFKSA